MELRSRPLCARCGRLVEHFTEEEFFGRLRFVARCHGEREVVDVQEHEAKELVFGMAFRETPRLGG